MELLHPHPRACECLLLPSALGEVSINAAESDDFSRRVEDWDSIAFQPSVGSVLVPPPQDEVLPAVLLTDQFRQLAFHILSVLRVQEFEARLANKLLRLVPNDLCDGGVGVGIPSLYIN